MRALPFLSLSALLLTLGAGVACAADAVESRDLVIKDHVFSPAEITIPAGKRVAIHIKNMDKTAEEFDSSALKVEKVIGGGGSGTVYLRPLAPGRYKFEGEYHDKTAQGVVIAQ